MNPSRKKPDWLKTSLPSGKAYLNIKNIIQNKSLNTICVSGKCPNLAECWNTQTATFMILGDICTRSCKFCATKTGIPLPIDNEEPEKLAETIANLGLKHCVITSVNRDDLEDGGANFWAKVIEQIKLKSQNITIETLIPDFNGNAELINIVIAAKPNIISHNIETIKRLTPIIRSKAQYDISLKTINTIAKSNSIKAKSGFMVGLGEKENEVYKTMDDLLNAGCQILTIGQYMQPTFKNIGVIEYIHPEIFAKYKEVALLKGFSFVESAPLVRSSYHAEKHI